MAGRAALAVVSGARQLVTLHLPAVRKPREMLVLSLLLICPLLSLSLWKGATDLQAESSLCSGTVLKMPAWKLPKVPLLCDS